MGGTHRPALAIQSGRVHAERLLPLILWVLVFVASGLVTGYSVPWQLALGTCGAMAWLAATDVIAVPLVMYFAAACAVATIGPRPSRYPVVTTRSAAANLAQRLRSRSSAAIDSTFEGDAPIARALLIADQSEIPRDVKRMYADAGIVHMLAISGLHVSIVAASLMLILNLLRIPPRAASFVAAGIIMTYVFILGFPAPALRAGVMVCLAAASRACQRHCSRWSFLALGGLVPLCDPATVLDVGYQLSTAGMAGVIAAGALLKRERLARLKGWRRAIGQSLVVSLVATIVTAPLVAGWFGRLSLIGPVTNLTADPVIAIVQPMLFLALILSPWPHAARFVASAAHPLLVSFAYIARTAASVPYAAIPVAVTPAALALLLTATAAFVGACVARFPARSALVALGATSAAVWLA